MSTKTPDAVYKIVLIGDAGVGKTSILARFAHEKARHKVRASSGNGNDDDNFDLNFKPTIGVEFESFDIFNKNKLIRVQIWDTAGQERYRAITKSQYRRANGAIVVFDVNKRITFDHAKSIWLPELEDTATDKTGLSKAIAFVGNKIDLRPKPSEENEISNFIREKEAGDLKNQDGDPIKYFQTSAKTGKGLGYDEDKNVFLYLIDKIHDNHEDVAAGKDPINLGNIEKNDNGDSNNCVPQKC